MGTKIYIIMNYIYIDNQDLSIKKIITRLVKYKKE